MKHLVNILILSAMFWLVPESFAQPISLQQSGDKLNLAKFVEYSVSSGDLSNPPVEGWSKWPTDEVNLGFSDELHWLRFTIRNDSAKAHNHVLHLDYALLDEIVVYTLVAGEVQQTQFLGDNQPFRQRPILDETFVLPLYFEPAQQQEFYIAFRTTGLAKAPLYLWRSEAFQEQQSHSQLINGAYVGIGLSGVLMALALALLSRQLTPLLDAGFILCLFMITMTISGVAFQYLWPQWPAMQQHSTFVFSCLAAAFSALLAHRNLQLIYFDHMLVSGFKWLAYAALILVPVTFFVSQKVALYFVTGMAISLCLLHVYTGLKSWRDGLHEQQELNLGLIVLLLVLTLISINNFTPLNLPVSNLVLLQFSLLFIVTVITFGLLGHHPDVQSRSELLDDKESLEAELSAQNFALQETLRELEDKNRELEKINTLDALSGIHNRRHFDKRILAELRRARRELSPLSLVLFDIDHFKSVNDNYGHLAGDEVIRTVALAAAELLQRSADEAFRYGGEEFALILPATDSQGAVQLAERIREKVAAEQVATAAGEINCTISLGVVCTVEVNLFTPAEFIELADKALYQAKRQGRNKVIQYFSEDVLNGTS